MVGSAAVHRKLHKVFVRNGLLKSRQFGIGIGNGDVDPADIIGQFFSSSTDEDHQTSTSSSVATSSTATRDTTSIVPATSNTLSSQITSTSASSSSILVASVVSTTSASQPILSATSQTVTFASTSSLLTSSPTADSNNSSPTTSAGNIVGIVAAVIIAILSLCVFGFFILRQRRKNRNAQLVHQVDPFRVELPDKELPPPPMSEQRMTFGTLYGRPGPVDPFAKTEINSSGVYIQSETYISSSVDATLAQSPFSDAAAIAPEKLATSTTVRNLTSPFADPYLPSVSPIASNFHRTPSPSQSPFADPSSTIQPPHPAALKHTPSYTATIDGSSRIPASAYNAVTRSSSGSQIPTPVASASRATDITSPGNEEETRSVTMYNEEDVYSGI
ncbi:hypothetical protein J3R30DRAFT_322614 [Lentinula aciculospora]|uniref:Uncharacterized protein n=1 Tax=Lentinula aciculospora TaxID=153920 RepID=A0A9W9A812_9AGAR|nr:hypothetical protein J3R30DRAFT_322614 [Lentinula aciculospora]